MSSLAGKKVIVTDALWRTSMSVIRSLGRAGCEVTAMGDSTFTIGFWSAMTHSRWKGPLAAQDLMGFDHFIRTQLSSLTERPLLIPMEEETLLWLDQNREAIGRVADFFIPNSKALRTALDKGETQEVAQNIGIPTPRTRRPKDTEEFTKQIEEQLRTGPVVIKPLRGRGSFGVQYLSAPPSDPKELWETKGPHVIQERIPEEGRALGASFLIDPKGEVKAQFVHERLEQYPNTGGPSTLRQGVEHPQVLELSLKLLKHLNWQGLAMVEWKVDPRDNTPKLMEINPRFWGSVELAVRSGVNFPKLYAQAALGEPLPPAPSYQVNKKVRWLIPGDLLRYLTSSKRENPLSFLMGWSQSEEWDWGDLRGFLATVLCTLALALHPRYWKYARSR